MPSPDPIRCDVLVLGTGVAGLQAAIAAAREGAKVSMAGWAKGASPYILGFNVALPEAGDDVARHVEDTLAGGYWLGRRDIVRAVCEQAPMAFADLRAWGVPFEQAEGRIALRHLSGSVRPRSVYVRSGTGVAVHRALVAQADALGIDVHAGWRVSELLGADRVCGAAAVSASGEFRLFRAGATVLAMGGIGGLYEDSTYPADILGDSYALALRAGASLVDMEFVQFEPTVVCWPEGAKGMEMPTAMLGDGAVLRNSQGERFMIRCNGPDAERNIEKARMANCIQAEIDAGRATAEGGVLFDARALPREVLEGYVSHHRRLLSAGLDPAREAVPVRPAAHSLMGGIEVDATFRTCVPALFACGEAAGGLHGASRIAGNGATDAIVTGRLAGQHAAWMARSPDNAEYARAAEGSHRRAQEEGASSTPSSAPSASGEFARLRAALSRCAGIRRDADGLRRASAALEDLRQTRRPGGSQRLARALLVAESIVQSALARTESRGAHLRTDHPEMSLEWTVSQRVTLDEKNRITVNRITEEQFA